MFCFHVVRVPKEKLLAPSHSHCLVATSFSELPPNLMVSERLSVTLQTFMSVVPSFLLLLFEFLVVQLEKTLDLMCRIVPATSVWGPLRALHVALDLCPWCWKSILFQSLFPWFWNSLSKVKNLWILFRISHRWRPFSSPFIYENLKWLSEIALAVFISMVIFCFSGRCWMDALELALKCSSLLKRTMIREGKEDTSTATTGGEHSINFYSLLRAHNIHGFQWVGHNLALLPCGFSLQPSCRHSSFQV